MPNLLPVGKGGVGTRALRFQNSVKVVGFYPTCITVCTNQGGIWHEKVRHMLKVCQILAGFVKVVEVWPCCLFCPSVCELAMALLVFLVKSTCIGSIALVLHFL